MSPEDVETYILSSFEDVAPKSSWGEQSFFLNPGRAFPSGAYFATLKFKDGPNDKASHLDREDVWRLNIGASPDMFLNLFNTRPTRPAKGEAISGPWDLQALDTLTPHPVYGWMSWISVLNPSQTVFEQCKPLLDSAYQKAAATLQKRLAKNTT